MGKNTLIILLTIIIGTGFGQNEIDSSEVINAEVENQAIQAVSAELETDTSSAIDSMVSEPDPVVEEPAEQPVQDDITVEQPDLNETVEKLDSIEKEVEPGSLLDFMPAEVKEEIFSTEALEVSYFTFLEELNVEELKSSGGIFGMLGAKEDIHSYKLVEYNNYLAAYFPGSHSDYVQKYIFDIFVIKSDWEQVISTATKFVYLYPESEIKQEVINTAVNLFQSEKYFRDNIDILLGMINTYVDPSNAISDRYFAFLESLRNYKSEAMLPIFVEEAGAFITLFPESKRTSDVILWLAQIDLAEEKFHTTYLKYRKILTTYPKSANLPYVLFGSGIIQADNFTEYELAITTLREFLLRYPSDTLAVMAQLKVAKIADEKLESWVQAVEEYQAFADTYPTDPEAPSALMRIGEIQLNELNQLNEAISTYHYLVQLYSTSADAIEALERCGIAYEKSKKYAEAVGEYFSIYEKYPDSENALPALVKCEELYTKRLKDNAKTKEILELIVEKFPDSKNAKSAQKKLSKM